MPGVLELYVTHANDYVNGNVAANTAFNISRANFELTIMRVLEKSTFPTEYKLAWLNAILISDLATSFWLSVQIQNSLPQSCIARYIPDSSLLNIEAPHSGIDEAPTTPPNRFPSLESSVTPPSGPDQTKNTHHEQSSSGITSGGGTRPLKSTTEPEEVWHGEDRPEDVKNEEPIRPINRRFRGPRMSTGGKGPRLNARIKARPKSNPAPKAKGEKPKPKRKRASGGEATQTNKKKKVEKGTI